MGTALDQADAEELLTVAELEAAQSIVYEHIAPTPQYAWPLLCEELDTEVWVKHENHTPIGAFKVRGGLVYMAQLERDDDVLVTATRGNHGQSIPYAARLYGKTVHVFVPEGNSKEKNRAMQAWGAELHVHGDDFDAAREAAEHFAADQEFALVPSFHKSLVQGVATYAFELMQAVADLATVYVPIGMGSGACSLIAVRDLLGLDTEIVGVVSTEADAIARSFEAGSIVETESARTFADGVATRVPHPQAFEIMRTGLARVVRVSDDEVADAMRCLYRTTHNISEGAGAVAAAALIQEKEIRKGRRVAVVMTGGNIDQDVFSRVLAGETPLVT